MSFLATTTVAVLRGTTTNELGDEIDENGTPVAGLDKLIAGIVERSRSVQDPSSGEWRKVTYYVCRLVPGTPVLEGDRLKDNSTGTIYNITTIGGAARSIAGQASLTLELSDTGA